MLNLWSVGIMVCQCIADNELRVKIKHMENIIQYYTKFVQKASEYYLEIPQSHTADQPTAS